MKSITFVLVLYSLLYGVISVSVDLLVKICSLFIVIQFSNSCNYVCCCMTVVSCLEHCVRIVRLSAYHRTCVFGPVAAGMF